MLPALLPAALLVSVALGGTAAAAAPVATCGSTVTTDVTLTADLYCPSGDGIILGSNVTLDLGGHSLVGDGSGVGVLTNLLSQGGNTIRNGTIENWETGILLREEPPDRAPYIVSDVVLLNSPVSHYVGITTLHLTRVTAVDSMIVGQFSSDLAISQSTLTRSDVRVFFATTATITDSAVIQSTVSAYQSQVLIDTSRLNGKGISALGSVSEGIISISNSVVKDYAEPMSGSWGGADFTNNTFTDMPNSVVRATSARTSGSMAHHTLWATRSPVAESRSEGTCR